MDDIRRAEQALVSSVVLAPERLTEVAGWLHPADFGSPVAALLYRRMLDVQREVGVMDPSRLLDELRARGELRSDGYPVSALTRWFDLVPKRPDPCAYGAVVVEGALGRQVEAAGTRLVQSADSAVSVRALAASVAQRAVLLAARRRWRELPAVVRTATAPRVAPLPAGPAVRSSAALERDPDAAHAELVTLGCLLEAPQLRARIVGWLRPRDFASPDIATAFSVVTAMAATGVAVDRVTVGAELHRFGGPPAAGDWAQLLDQAQASVPVAGSVAFYARQVLDAAVTSDVAVVGYRLAELGRSRPGGAAAMLDTALEELDSVGELHRRVRRSRLITPTRPSVTVGRTAMSRPDLERRVERTAG